MYKGYVDDPRNTDNAWMETVAVNFHDDTGEIFSEFKLQVSCFCIGTPGRWKGRSEESLYKPLLICKPTTTFFGRKVFLFIYLLPHTYCLDTWTLAYRSRQTPPPLPSSSPPPPPPQSLNETPFLTFWKFFDSHSQAGDDAAAVRWQRVSGNIPLFASHVSILEKVAKIRNAAF